MASNWCASYGDCHACGPRKTCELNEDGTIRHECYPLDDDDCKVSAACSVRGGCKHNGGIGPKGASCVPSAPQDCSLSLNCKSMGICGIAGTGPDAYCVPTPEGCTKSLGCQESGRCQLVKHAELGYPVCEPTSSADCKFSQGCKLWGNCTFDPKTRACAP